MATVGHRHLSAIVGLVLLAQVGNLVGHFAAVEHTISEQSGRLSHVAPCDSEHETNERPAFAPGCEDQHDEHECTVWTLLRQTVEVDAPAFVIPAPAAYELPVDALPATPARVLAYAPKQSPPVRA